MGLQGLRLAIFVALLAGSFVAGFAFLYSPSAGEIQGANAPAPQPQVDRRAEGDDEKKSEQAAAARRDPEPGPAPTQPEAKPSPSAPEPEKPLTRAQVAELGGDCIGRRVSWVAVKWLSQSTKIGKQEGTQHIFRTQDAQGEFTFDLPFIAEEPKPLKLDMRQRTKEELHRDLEEYKKFQKKTGLKGRQLVEAYAKYQMKIVTVTGTISRLDTLICTYGTRYKVPVLTNFTITPNP
jgi:hypothetical protein